MAVGSMNIVRQLLDKKEMISMEWDDIYRTMPLERIPWHSEKPPESLVRNVRKLKHGNALDLCCGAGTNSIFLAKNGFMVTAIDISESAVDIAKMRAGKEGVKVDFRVGDVLDFDPGKKIDFAFDRGCFHHVPLSKRMEFAVNLAGFVKPGGKFQLMAFSDRNGFEKSLEKEDIKKIFSPYFDVEEIDEELHIEPDGSRIYMHVALMTRRRDHVAA